jgi:predicted AAA+ superfamily ATPase
VLCCPPPSTERSRSRAVVLVGPRQVGKTTLARALLPTDSPNWFDLEDPAAAAALAQPMAALQGLRGLVVIDEVQLAPDLFKVLRVLIDRADRPARFLLLGSASPALLRQSAESLTGRIEVIEAGGFTLTDVGRSATESLCVGADSHCPHHANGRLKPAQAAPPPASHPRDQLRQGQETHNPTVLPGEV